MAASERSERTPEESSKSGDEGTATWERRAREEADAAAREAADIGGPGAPGGEDPADQPVAEGGGGEAGGFEESEAELIEHASHGDPAPDPEQDAFDPELDEERAERGAADHEHSSARRE